MKLTTTDAQDVTRFHGLVYGDSGIGKTTSLRTLPKDSTLIAASERSLLPLRGLGYKVDRIECWDDVRDLVATLRESQTVEGMEVKTLAIDSLSDFSEICARQIVTVDRPVLCNQRTKGKAEAPIGVYADQLTMEDYGLLRTRLSALVSTVVQLPMHVIFTCLSQWQEDKVTGANQRVPALSGKFAREVAKYFDVVVHMESAKNGDGDEVRVWRTANDGTVIAKDSTGRLDVFEETNWTKLITKALETRKATK